ncbi:hypothetical protein [Lactobacillus sp. LL6]|uniref:hypothetical protein n=1 Tax=Lactobacillus sp. LL6 TaxID=2596827 RepID=UPI00118655F4|nr:hypothetical protein [Lactobacillus sp. LL6]TSO25343.1 hypothetical protein FOD82_08900 [Lactobacillus sp. LL6]
MSKKINIKQPASVQRAAQEMNPADALVDSISRRDRSTGKHLSEEVDHRKKPVEELRSEKRVLSVTKQIDSDLRIMAAYYGDSINEVVNKAIIDLIKKTDKKDEFQSVLKFLEKSNKSEWKI